MTYGWRCRECITLYDPVFVRLLLMDRSYHQRIYNSSFSQLENMGDEEVSCKLNMMSKAVTYNSVHLGECQNSTVNVVIPAHKGTWSNASTLTLLGLET